MKMATTIQSSSIVQYILLYLKLRYNLHKKKHMCPFIFCKHVDISYLYILYSRFPEGYPNYVFWIAWCYGYANDYLLGQLKKSQHMYIVMYSHLLLNWQCQGRLSYT
jgi:hypothetical protein